jgi:uncharacterized protein (TIGR02231 family)
MQSRLSARLFAPLCASLFFAWSAAGHAQPVAPSPTVPSRIAQVKVYPGSAAVERVMRVAAGSRSLTFACLPAGLDVQSLQVTAPASVRVGETSVLTQARELSSQCSSNALDGRIRDLEEQKEALQSESDALGLVTGYLKGLANTGDDPSGKHLAADARSIAPVADAMRRTGQDAMQKQRQIARRQTDIDKQLTPLLAERKRLLGTGNVVAVTVTLATDAEADVRLSYQINGPGWSPAYRALLDTTTRRVRIERQALVAQATGEDWTGVKLVLATGQPRRETSGRLPVSWRIGIEPPHADSMRFASAPAPAPVAMAGVSLQRASPESPLFDVSVFNGSYATEFSVPQAIDVPSNGQRVVMSLGQLEESVVLAARAAPRADTGAFLVAELSHPGGVWPSGPLQLYRDGAFVGNGQWTAPEGERLTLSFGRDELVRVEAEPERDNRGSGGFIGGRAERTIQRGYVVENRHATPITVQLLEAAPVSIDEQVRVATQFNPLPAESAWNKQPGLAMWSVDLGAGKSARVAAAYVISYPKDARLQER